MEVSHFYVFSFAFAFIIQLSKGSEYNLPLLRLESLAENFGQTMYDTCTRSTAVTDLKIDYLLMDPRVHPIDGHNLTSSIKRSVHAMFKKKSKAVKILAKVSELAVKQHIFDPNLKMTFPESKNLNSSDFELVKSSRFNDMMVNFTMSTVHIPNNVYEKSAEVLNGVAWSANLDEVFKKNTHADRDLKWQYLCSSAGFFRMFPGTTWQKVKTNQIHPNVYDCRMQKWYIQAATSPKAVVFLLDVGDAMKKKLSFAKKILRFFMDTLTDEDYFNVIIFSEKFHYVDSCSNSSLLYANDDNKNKVIKYLDALKISSGIKTYHVEALKEALSVLGILNNTAHENSTCNKAVVLFTTYLPPSLVEIVQSFNQPVFQARIFIYMMNRDKKTLALAKQIACGNKGYHAVLESEDQAAEQLLNFIGVLSRTSPPSTNHITWTNVYEDTAGLDLIITIALPVFTEKSFVGVVGVDISVNEFGRLFETFQLGVDAHVFIATNKGHAVYHPELKVKNKYKYEFSFNPNSNLVDIAHLEQTSNIREIKRQMMDRVSGSLQAETTVLYDGSKRIASKHVHYYFTELHESPFSMGLSLPSRYGKAIVDGLKSINDFDLSTLQTENFQIAPWEYCSFDFKANSSAETFHKQIKDIKSNPSFAMENCNMELVKSILFDIEATRGSYVNWIKENWNSDAFYVMKDGIELVFLGTKGGLTRYYPLSDDPRLKEYIESQASTTHSLYYLRAVYNGEEIFTFSLPFQPGKETPASSHLPPPPLHHPTADPDSMVVAGSTPIVIHDEGNEGVVAVAGLLIKYSKFRELFLNSTPPCPPDKPKCPKICEADEIDCYLIDYNGYVVYSENSKDLGLFLGDLEGSASVLLKDLVIKDGEKNDMLKRGVFKRVERRDYQAVCEIIRKSASNSESLFSNFSIKNMFSLLTWLLHELVLFLVQFNVSEAFILGRSSQKAETNATTTPTWEDKSFFSSLPMSPEDEEATDLEGFRSLMSDLTKISSKEQVEKWKENCLRQSGYNPEMTVSCLRNIKKAYEPGIRGFRPCVQSYVRYIADPARLPQSGIVFKCDLCTKSYSINLVPRTNLMMLSIDSLCHCSEGPAAEDKTSELNSQLDGDQPCEKLNVDSIPSPWIDGKCPAPVSNKEPQEEEEMCGRGSSVHQSRTVLLLQFVFSIFLLFRFYQHRRTL